MCGMVVNARRGGRSPFKPVKHLCRVMAELGEDRRGGPVHKIFWPVMLVALIDLCCWSIVLVVLLRVLQCGLGRQLLQVLAG